MKDDTLHGLAVTSGATIYAMSLASMSAFYEACFALVEPALLIAWTEPGRA